MIKYNDYGFNSVNILFSDFVTTSDICTCILEDEALFFNAFLRNTLVNYYDVNPITFYFLDGGLL